MDQKASREYLLRRGTKLFDKLDQQVDPDLVSDQEYTLSTLLRILDHREELASYIRRKNRGKNRQLLVKHAIYLGMSQRNPQARPICKGYCIFVDHWIACQCLIPRSSLKPKAIFILFPLQVMDFF